MSYPDEFDALHKSLVNDAKQHPEYANNQVSGLYGYSEGAEHALETVRLKGYRKPRIITTVDELVTFPQGAKFYSSKTTHSWQLNDLTKFRGTLVQGTGGGYTYLSDFIEHEAPLTVLYVPEES